MAYTLVDGNKLQVTEPAPDRVEQFSKSRLVELQAYAQSQCAHWAAELKKYDLWLEEAAKLGL